MQSPGNLERKVMSEKWSYAKLLMITQIHIRVVEIFKISIRVCEINRPQPLYQVGCYLLCIPAWPSWKRDHDRGCIHQLQAHKQSSLLNVQGWWWQGTASLIGVSGVRFLFLNEKTEAGTGGWTDWHNYFFYTQKSTSVILSSIMFPSRTAFFVPDFEPSTWDNLWSQFPVRVKFYIIYEINSRKAQEQQTAEILCLLDSKIPNFLLTALETRGRWQGRYFQSPVASYSGSWTV